MGAAHLVTCAADVKELVAVSGEDLVEDVDERIDFSDDGTDIAYGIGADYRAGRNLRLRLELQYYDIEITKDVWNVMASLQYGIQFRR